MSHLPTDTRPLLHQKSLGQPPIPSRPANIAWLLSDDADWVTGQIWSVDGGLAALRPRPKA